MVVHMCYRMLHARPKPSIRGGLRKDLANYLLKKIAKKVLWKKLSRVTGIEGRGSYNIF